MSAPSAPRRARASQPSQDPSKRTTAALVGGTSLLMLASMAVATGSAGGSTTADPTTATATTATTAAANGLKVTDTAIPALPVAAGKRASRELDLDLDATSVASNSRLLGHVRADAVADFSVYGVTWDAGSGSGDVTVLMRTESDQGWSEWSELHQDMDGGPRSAAEDSSYRAGTEPEWVGDGTGFEVAVYGTGKAPTGLQVSAIDPGDDPVAAKSGVEPAVGVGKAGTYVNMPRVIRRQGWGADERLGDECWDPKYGTTFKSVIVHHTAGSNDYSKREAKAVVRGVYAYHTQSRGWCDIGYNFLIDRYGRVYEGRDGGVRRPVRGAHAGDYNVNTTGISLMGNFDIAQPTKQMKNALVRLVAWRLGTAYHTAYGKPFLFDGRFKRISGHRDVMATACPGRYVYDWLPGLRKRVTTRLGGYESPIQKSYLRSTSKKKALGPVSIGERQNERGQYTIFRRGAMFSSRGNGVRTLPDGAILTRYRKIGMGNSAIGYPRSGVLRVEGTAGLRAMFENGRIYWSPRAGAHDLRSGKILNRYAALGAATGRLGFPKSSVYDIAGGTKARFQHGVITFSTTSGRVSVEFR